MTKNISTESPKIVFRKTLELTANPKNARTHGQSQINKIAASIKRFKFLNPIIIDDKGIVIAGHGRLEAAKQLSLEQVPCVLAGHLSKAEKMAYMLADNRIALDSGWDEDLLRVNLEELRALDFDISLTGFDGHEIDDFFKVPTIQDEDDVPEPPKVPKSKLGDIFMLGDHRLMCGDSTNPDTVAALMNGQNADMVFTDPPYNVAYSGRGQNNLGTIENDDMSDNDFDAFLEKVFDSYLNSMRSLACIYVCHPDSQSAPKIAFENSFARRFKKSSTIIWAKQSAGMGWQDYRAQHEPILYGWKEGKGKHYFCGDRTKTTVWNISRDSQSGYVHPTQKPVALPEEAIQNSSQNGESVLDLFGGSGSTLIACEKTGRKCFMMELDPHYVDVIIERWEGFSGKKAEKLKSS